VHGDCQRSGQLLLPEHAICAAAGAAFAAALLPVLTFCTREKFALEIKCQDRSVDATLRAAIGFSIVQQGGRWRSELQNFRAWRGVEDDATPLAVEAGKDGTQIVI
jgi:hypothetical protein